ncbi:response regulator [Campylobacter sp. 19-13652]|uniref:response regulator n=1 Tax=Campylobacter sp. 19-13652 TaxID=2840180 RepID=UPI001C76D3EF|nr:response regulator [Campylobacter sp. 19-13652]BCX79729.1 response regulator [Campylobacter sp. 19-13652]
MKVLIIENEIYLAGSIASKLADAGHDCEIAKTVNEALKQENVDVVLLSTSIVGQDFYPVIENFKDSIIILLISYISADTVSKPIKAGASDYIQKPFMIDELMRKIEHFTTHRYMKRLIQSYEKFIEHSLRGIEYDAAMIKKVRLPLLIKCSTMTQADKIVFAISKHIKMPFILIPSVAGSTLKALNSCAKDEIAYIRNFQLLKQEEQEAILLASHKKKVVIATSDDALEYNIETLNLGAGVQNVSLDGILSIDEYIKNIISGYQERLPDTEIAKRLGISRKSLWEKRKKYDVVKKR